MKNRTVTHLLYAHPYDMGGMPIRQPLPTNNVQQVDPFLLLHHADVAVPEHLEPAHAGVGPHPHRGFSPVTFIFKGAVHHRDSRGNNSVVYAGGAQWMNAGMGVIHSERPSNDIHDIGGRQEIIQLWINTPSKHKMDQPAYYPVQADDVPKFVSDDKLAAVNVFAGDVLGIKGPVPSLSPVNAATIEVKKGARLAIPVPADFNAFLYLLDGQITLDGYGIIDGLNAAVFARDGEGISFTALQDTRLLLMSGKPLDEEVVSHGPFVMNTQTQILEAMRDYQMGKMGILIED
ncbi:pirin family protein [Fulvivirgaceae bacterium PWU4]|uniref:Pirin family protein n=1 Tax=Chryseosolibacter histidini TaxID=2782349 RepID=A0AAP2DTN5_9BACT|nr:pirin family protein [Chryseosolibacter histidini]MBT1701128.1 pirin family protein [Chryseosolibacter histidini]